MTGGTRASVTRCEADLKYTYLYTLQVGSKCLRTYSVAFV
jgi:hypothetical protein